MSGPDNDIADNAIAIVGLAGRFPGAEDAEQFWANVRRGVTSLTRFAEADLEDSFPAEVRAAANFVRARPILPKVDLFDAEFFGMLPREAALTDPQHRLLLECAWTALEDAGVDPSRFPGAIGVFAGCSMNTYLLTHVLAERLDADRFASDYQVGSYDALLGALSDTLATRIAYKLDLHGPAMTVQSACSTSLLAVAEACQSLLLHQSDMALAGGVSITFPQKRGYLHQDGGMVSPDGICRPFDDAAAGTIFGDGAAMVVLKRLADALGDGDRIYAVIRGSAINNDGSDKVGFTAPSVRGQAEVIASALAAADVDAGSIGYVECHGTATPLGDPIEFAGLLEGFGGQRVARAHCALGSAKANVGHLDVASGVTGLIKAALALHHGEIPPLANFRTPNRHIDIAGSPFYFPIQPVAWPHGAEPRRAGVSSFGVGGTNVHVVLEEAPPIAAASAAPPSSARSHVLPLSARNDAALSAMAAALAEHLDRHPDLSLDDVARTLQSGRHAFERRAVVACTTRAEAIAALQSLPMPPAARTPGERARLVFMFPGQGAQFPGMASALHRDHAIFRALVDEGIDVAAPIVGSGLGPQLLDPAATGGNATLLAQPALFIFEYALARLWMSWGFEPDVLVGHSVGEFAAACLAGVFSFPEGCRLVAMRARIMQDMPAGAMLAVRLPEADLRREIGPALDIAAVNAPSLCVAAGPVEEIEALAARLTAKDISCRRLDVSHAFHSRALDPALPAIEHAAATTVLAPPHLAIASCVTGDWVGANATDPAYWARHGRMPVRFAAALATATMTGPSFLLEVGPGRALSALAPQTVDRKILRGAAAGVDDATGDLSAALAALWGAGFDLDWSLVMPARGRRVSLPTYRFQRSRHWIERTGQRAPSVAPGPPIAEAPTPNIPARRDGTLEAGIIEILQELSGISDIDPQETFVALGFDSLLLGQVARAVEKKYRTKITFRQLLTELPSVSRLAAYLETIVPVDGTMDGTVAATPRPVGIPQLQASSRIQLVRPAAGADQSLTATQRAYIDDLVRRVNERTPLSKATTQRDRAVLADPRTVAGFRLEWKELVYPVIAERAKGSRIWDIDGNEYIDLVNGYGQTMFGHSPDFVTGAVAAQLQMGFPIGPQSPLAGEVAALVAAMTGDERVTFCNTGSEAVMAAMRVARAVTGRERIVVFGNDYHGQFDEVLVKAGGGATPRALPVAPGIPPEAVANMTVLPYGDPRSLDWIDANGADIAAVLVEPVQSRHPELRPQAFVKKLRTITEMRGAALVFDEIVTGFRAHPGGMQALFGVRADLATYGKVVGGGMPVGILAGKARFMDALDGGAWRFGDDSIPEVAPTFFAGTFVRHPLALAATKAVLLHLKEQGPALQEQLAARMSGLVGRVNVELARRELLTRAEGFSSWFHLNFSAEHPLASLLWPQLRLLGIHVQDGYPCFLTTAHSDADIDAIAAAFTTALDALEAGGILDAVRAARPSSRSSSHPALPPEESAPLTDPQLEILTAAQIGSEASCAFNESVSLAFDGDLDIPALTAALEDVVARHQALRGRVGRTDERMHFAPSLELAPPLRDLSQEREPAAALAAIVAADARTPFDLFAGPLVRATLARLDVRRHVLVLTAHHIVCDGWSINIVLNDLAALYRAAHEGRAPELPDAPRFLRYAERQAATKDAQNADLAYWLSRYGDLPALPDLPTDRPRPVERSHAGSTWSTLFDAELAAAVRKAGAGSGATLFSVLFTALQTVFARLSGVPDIVMGVPVAGQPVDDDPGLVGHCVQMLPLRTLLEWNAPFSEHVRTVARRLLDDFDHPRCTYGTLVRALPLRRSANRLPLTEIQFNLERLADGLDFGALEVTATPNAKAAVNFDIFVNVRESAAGLRIDCDYNTDLFDATTIARWMDHYRRVLEGIAAAPATTMSDLPFLSPEQEHFALDEVNASDADYPRQTCIHDLFAQQAAATPDATAIVDAAGAMTYAELDSRSTRLAREMLAVNKARHGRIGIAVDRSRILPISLLATMKAGHAYVPLDVRQPLARLRQIALAARIDGIICHDEHIRSIAPHAFAVRIDQLDLDQLDRDQPLDAPSLTPVSADASAYILFTSGSTGAPKGVEVGHRALTNLICDVIRRCEMGASDVAIASTALTFDVAATELYAPLVSGGRVVLSDIDEVKTGVELVARARKSGATLMQATPTLWRMLGEAGFVSHPGLKMISVGEALSADLADRLLAGGGRLWNFYGPTETTIYSSACEMQRGSAVVTIGKPLANTQLLVLDEHHRLTPPGVVGQLFIGGDGLAKGYFDRSDLTAQAFATISLAGRPARRLYATGDLARLLPSGEFDLQGRIDHQVKLRGFRIELEEIEAVLRQIRGICDCAVLLRRDVGPDAVLVAYVVLEAGVKSSELAAHLATRLPDYMIPARWVGLDAMPMTPNGKADRQALPPPGPVASLPVAAESRSRRPVEVTISAVWANVLGLPEVGIHAPLFDLGADSLQVFRIAAQLEQAGIPVGARELMKNPTVAALAEAIDGKSDALRRTPAAKGPSLADFRRGARRHTLTP